MTLFHNIHTLSIGNFAEMIATENTYMVVKWPIWMPKRWVNKAYKQLMIDHNKNVSPEKVEQMISSDLTKLTVLNKVNITYPILLKLADLTAKYDDKGDLRDMFSEVYKQVYGREFKTAADIERIAKDQDLLIRKYKQLYGDEENKSEDVNFEKVLGSLEMILAPLTIRDKKLYTLPVYLDMANEKIKQNG